MSDVSDAQVTIAWAPGYSGRATAMTVHILESGWLRVHWTPSNVTYVSPSAVRELTGKGVIISDA